MRYLTILFLFFISCSEGENKKYDNGLVAKTDTIVGSQEPYDFWKEHSSYAGIVKRDSIDGKPVEFYLTHPRMIAVGKAFYEGRFRPLDDDSTFALLDSASTRDSILRPFYVYCFDMILKMSDGALSEGMWGYAMNYVWKYPREFIELADRKEISYTDWADRISFDAAWEYRSTVKDIDSMSEDDVRTMTAAISKDIKKNCKGCSSYILNRIDILSAYVVGSCGICE
jgi:hypothetical protein